MPSAETAHEEVLELGAELHLIAASASARQHAAQDRARTVRPRLAFDEHVARQACDVRAPRKRREARRVGHRFEVGIARALADVAGGEAGEAGALLEQVVEMVRRHELRVRLAVHVDELGEEEADVAVVHVGADLIDRPRHRPAVGRRSCCGALLGLRQAAALLRAVMGWAVERDRPLWSAPSNATAAAHAMCGCLHSDAAGWMDGPRKAAAGGCMWRKPTYRASTVPVAHMETGAAGA